MPRVAPVSHYLAGEEIRMDRPKTCLQVNTRTRKATPLKLSKRTWTLIGGDLFLWPTILEKQMRRRKYSSPSVTPEECYIHPGCHGDVISLRRILLRGLSCSLNVANYTESIGEQRLRKTRDESSLVSGYRVFSLT